ncbi:cytochrome P450 [Ophiocordyceps camponoti-floridani]|uniref:Cytochrome P450 n=1 Tax=Ophiocordyceps camponoti-floridani TaxID=2030778 RepID=A0A8H4VEI4_9HYPO|nr:cytochrome P450 [Ophiocordyceps camponoti-floridani]
MALVVIPALLIVIAILILYNVNKNRCPPGSRPLPGPKNFPLIGRVHDIPPAMSWMKFYEWGKTYGPIYQLKVFGKVQIWVSSEKMAHDLFAKRSAIYSDRPVIGTLPDNRTSGLYLALMGRTETWKKQRKLSMQLMHPSIANAFHGYPTRERDRLLRNLCHRPSNYQDFIEQFTSRTISRVSWGTAHPAPMLRQTTFGLLETISPASSPPNIISWLTHLPTRLSPWRRRELARQVVERSLFNDSVAHVRDLSNAEEAQPPAPNLTLTYLQRNQAADEKSGKEADIGEATSVIGQLAIAGALTIGSPIQSFLLAACHYPQWLQQLQMEIDTALDGRCPEWTDSPKLPLLRAVVKEVIRWRPPVPTGIPHVAEKDDVYDGYFIPAGATIHALEWAFTRDETVYPDPETFNPARWLTPDYPTYREPLSIYPNLQGHSQFGFGPRMCVGVNLVEQCLFLAIGGLAWGFNVSKKRDLVSGAEIPIPWNEMTSMLIAKPVPFDFDLLPRQPCLLDDEKAGL